MTTAIEGILSGPTEQCDNGLDDDGNDLIDDGCNCSVGETQSCFPGGTPGVCTGMQTCMGSNEFGSWSECEAEEICGDGIDQDCDGEDLECPRPTDACDDLAWDMRTQVLEFQNPLNLLGQCPWNVGDNLGRTAGVMAARHEVIKSLEPPPNAILCSVRFGVPQTGMYYDDIMYILFNDVVILSPSPWNSMLEEVDGLLLYDWIRIRGRRGGSPPAYCPGTNSTCELPDTQQNGSITLKLDEPTQLLLFDRAANSGTYDVTVAATGDDNRSRDCSHSDFNLEVTYEYVVP